MEELHFEDKRFDWPDWGEEEEVTNLRVVNPFIGWENLPKEEGEKDVRDIPAHKSGR